MYCKALRAPRLVAGEAAEPDRPQPARARQAADQRVADPAPAAGLA